MIMNSHLDTGLIGWSGKAMKLQSQNSPHASAGSFRQYLDKIRSPSGLETLTPNAIRTLAVNLISALDRASMHAMFFDLNDGQRNSPSSLLSTDLFMTIRNSAMTPKYTVQEKTMNQSALLSAPSGESTTGMGAMTQNHDKLMPSDSIGGKYASIIAAAAATHGLDPKLIVAVVQTESDFNAQAVSPAGAQGLMQLMPGTAAELGVSDAFNPEQNIQAGSRYLKQLMDRYDGDIGLTLAAYNWGMGNLERHPERMPQETVNYVAKITGLMSKMA